MLVFLNALYKIYLCHNMKNIFNQANNLDWCTVLKSVKLGSLVIVKRITPIFYGAQSHKSTKLIESYKK